MNIINIAKKNKNSLLYRIAIRLYMFFSIQRLFYMYFRDSILLAYKTIKACRVYKYPKTIQLPITYKCNYDCVMCGMRKLTTKKDLSAKELSSILDDKLFKKIITIGLNGGEPFLKQDLVDCVKVFIEKIPNLKNLNIISNGYFTNIITDKLAAIYKLCLENGIKVNISFSLDGIGELQNYMRGNSMAWEKILNTLDEIKNHKEKYCDTFQLICTVTKHNVYNLPEVDSWAKRNNIRISYNIATIHARICNEDKYDDFTIFNDEKAKMLASEFFYKKAMELRSQNYFGIYLYILYGKRYSFCSCQNNSWVTLTPSGDICYCATHSKELGNALHRSAYKIFNENTDYLEEIKKHYCKECSHYNNKLTKKGLDLFYKELIHNQKVLY